jgi:hypothetical protein
VVADLIFEIGDSLLAFERLTPLLCMLIALNFALLADDASGWCAAEAVRGADESNPVVIGVVV